MAKTTSAVLGKQSGKIGEIVGRIWRGEQVYSAYNSNVRNPKSAKQLIVRAIFSNLAALSMGFRPAIKEGFYYACKSTKLSPRNMFFKKNKSAVTAVSAEEVTINYANIKLAHGSLGTPNCGAPDFDTAGKVIVPLDTYVQTEDNAADDQVMVVVYQPDSAKCIVSDGVDRSESEVTVNVPAAWSGMKVHVYAYAIGSETHAQYEGIPSDSVYVGTGDLA